MLQSKRIKSKIKKIECKQFENDDIKSLCHLELATPVWSPFHKKYKLVIEDATKRATKLVPGQVDTFILDFEKAFDTPPPLMNFLKANCLAMEFEEKL